MTFISGSGRRRVKMRQEQQRIRLLSSMTVRAIFYLIFQLISNCILGV